jgi:hypothetical protein
MIILQIIGGVVVAVMLLLLVGYLYIRFKFGKFHNAEVQPEPLAINLVEDIDPDWQNSKAATTLIKQLDALGYRPGTPYAIYEMEGVFLQPFYRTPLAAVVYHHKLAGCWVDIVIDEESGLEYTFSNAPMGAGMGERPECKKFMDPSASLPDLHARAEAIASKDDTSFRSITESTFREYFESAYKKDMAWKNRKGGITREEFERMAGEASFSTSKKTRGRAFIATKLDEMFRWEEATLSEYQQQNGLSDEAYYALTDRAFIVPFTTDTTAFLEYLETTGFLTESQREKLVGKCARVRDTRKLFQKINKLFPEKLRAEKLCDCTYPLELELYQLSEAMQRLQR